MAEGEEQKGPKEFLEPDSLQKPHGYHHNSLRQNGPTPGFIAGLASLFVRKFRWSHEVLKEYGEWEPPDEMEAR